MSGLSRGCRTSLGPRAWHLSRIFERQVARALAVRGDVALSRQGATVPPSHPRVAIREPLAGALRTLAADAPRLDLSPRTDWIV
jgi:hypothetical protein